MHVCLCRDFNDKKVVAVIKAHPEASRVKDIYKLCSGAPEPQCSKCLITIRDIREAQVRPGCPRL